MQTPAQGARLTSADRADPHVVDYLAATATVRRLEAELADARTAADTSAALMDAGAGDARGRLGRVAAAVGVEEQSLRNQRMRGKQPPARPARGATPRRVLTAAQYAAALTRADAGARAAHHQVPDPALDAVVSGAFAAVGLLSPPPNPEDGDGTVCTARYPDPDGEWWQCQEDPGHDGRHDAGGWAWSDDDPEAIPAR